MEPIKTPYPVCAVKVKNSAYSGFINDQTNKNCGTIPPNSLCESAKTHGITSAPAPLQVPHVMLVPYWTANDALTLIMVDA